MSNLPVIKNWVFVLYFKGKKTKRYRIMQRTYHEADKEAMSYVEKVEPDCSDWAIVPREKIDRKLKEL